MGRGINMEKDILKIFQREIERQCKFAIIAIDEIKSGLLNNNSDIVWYAIQNFLIAVGNVSKIFWPSYERYQEQGEKLMENGVEEKAEKLMKKAEELRKRGEELRKRLDIEDNSSIQPRNFRNHFEHFDERLELWATSSKRHNFVDSNIGPSNMIAGIDAEDFLRNFDDTAWTLTFRGDKYELKPIIDAIYDLYQKVLSEVNKPWWE